jgi:Concanavalin A-like lectin/glucanases superfamily/FG-GAP-like repeat
MKTKFSHWLMALTLFALATLNSPLSTAHASVTNVVWYRLGENDPGAANGVTATSTTDLMGFENLQQFGSPAYINNISTVASTNVGSSLAVRFNGINQFQYLSNGVVSTAVDNFGIEAWVFPENITPGIDHLIAFNGNAGTNGEGSGWGIYLNGTSYLARLGASGGAVTLGAGSTDAAMFTWAHVALVRVNGTTTLYVNGVAVDSNSVDQPLPPVGGFTIGNILPAPLGQVFRGVIDEVRVFTFPFNQVPLNAQFSTNDLLFNLHRVSTLPASPGSTFATLNGTVHPPGLPTSAWFEWGATTNYGNVTTSQLFGGQSLGDPVSGSTFFNQNISGLVPGSTYHYHAAVSNSLGVAYGQDQSFGTPFVTTLPATAVGTNTATLNGVANPAGMGDLQPIYFEWGTTTNYGHQTPSTSLGNTTNNFNFSQTIGSLSAGVTYHFRAEAIQNFGTNYGADQSFTTLLPAVVTTLPADTLGLSNATLNATANPEGLATIVWFQWGTTPSLGNNTLAQAAGNGVGNLTFSNVLSGLAGGGTYYFRAMASNSAGVINGTTLSFTLPVPPVITTFAASAIDAATAALNGTANPGGAATTAWFEWGTTTNYGNIAPTQPVGAGTSNTNFSQIITGLFGGVTYNFRAVASNSFGTSFGTNLNFTTPVFSMTVTNLPGSSDGSGTWADYDNDGRLDILLISQGSAQLWRNAGNGFTNSSILFQGVIFSAAWGDYDNDGKIDLAALGFNNLSYVATRILHNSTTNFTYNYEYTNNSPPSAVGHGYVAWGDYDNDGKLDLIQAGTGNLGNICQLLKNLGKAFTDVNDFPGVFPSSIVWGDYDNDGRLDILLCGRSNTGLITQVWRNTGSGFTNINAGLPGVEQGSAAWGDYDNDGRLDILLCGADNTGTNTITQVWRNTGSGFTNINAGLPGVSLGSAAWGDYDNDGRLDILLCGSFTNFITQVWRNTGSGFSNINAGLSGIDDGSAAWGDYDNDGRLDILLTGTPNNSGQTITEIWRNNTPITNTPPMAPTGLVATPGSNGVTFSWNAATDAQTPASGLTYNLRVGTTPGGGELVSPMAATSGQRRLPQMGNAQMNLFRTITGLPLGQPIYWSVQAVDTAFAGGSFAPEKTFAYNSVLAPPNGIPVPGDTDGDGMVSQSELAAILPSLNGNGIISQSELNLVLSNYFPNSPFLLMTNVAGLGGTNVTFALSNSTAGAFSVEYSTNLTSWQFLGPATPRYLFTDTNAPAGPQRFYRLRWP